MQHFYQWVIETPALFELEQSAPFTSFEHLGLSQQRPEAMVYQGNPRLGFVYQYLCDQVLKHSSQFEVVEQEIQLNQNGKTLGAIDFIVRDHQQSQLQHWEVAIKFYLLHGDSWYGPNAHDRLDKKLQRMLEHQLTLTQHPAFIEQYPDYQHLFTQLLMQGRLYTNPFSAQAVPQYCLGHKLNSSQIQGYWCYSHQWHHIGEPLFALEKHQWATGLEPQHQHTPITEFSGRFIHAQSASGQFWFIVNEQWPHDNN
ncbi:DUF1853 family protein [Vibrio olivae]|uniref:DUF1853 family protein n=1 Tax=Vibrio olivae TaxID=1243002 RepID=A0ABV5HH56_9VIBR